MKNNKKTKSQYRNSKIKEYFFCGTLIIYEVFPNIISGTHKKFSNKQEKSLYFLHKKEYKKEYGLKIRGKRGGSLPDCWDDYPSYVYDVAKSWKHNSKRKNQYYKEK